MLDIKNTQTLKQNRHKYPILIQSHVYFTCIKHFLIWHESAYFFSNCIKSWWVEGHFNRVHRVTGNRGIILFGLFNPLESFTVTLLCCCE